jgi:hypothetical protein
MRKLCWILAVGALVMAGPTGPASAATSHASCPGQELSALGPMLGADLGAFIRSRLAFPNSKEGGTSVPK